MISAGKHPEYPRVYLIPRFNWSWMMGFFYVYWWHWGIGYIPNLTGESAGWNWRKRP